MKPDELKVGDRIRIIGIPGKGIAGCVLLPETRRVYKKLIARRKSVRISRIDGYGSPWYDCRFRLRNGQWDRHSLAVFDTDNNWQLVKRRPKSRH